MSYERGLLSSTLRFEPVFDASRYVRGARPSIQALETAFDDLLAALCDCTFSFPNIYFFLDNNCVQHCC